MDLQITRQLYLQPSTEASLEVLLYKRKVKGNKIDNEKHPNSDHDKVSKLPYLGTGVPYSSQIFIVSIYLLPFLRNGSLPFS